MPQKQIPLKENNGRKEEYFDDVKQHFIYSGNPEIFMNSDRILFKDKVDKRFGWAEIALLSNSSWNLTYCIDIAKYYLILSLEKNVKKLTDKKPDKFENIDRYNDFIRALEHRFMLPSILFYNASFDYLYIFIFSLLTIRKEIVESKKTNKDKVLKEAERLDLSNKKFSWMFALNSLITKDKSIIKQIEKKLNQYLCHEFIMILDELKMESKKLRINYYANLIKHQQIPFFKPKCNYNVGGAKSLIDINKYFSIDEITPSITFGIPETVLDIEKTQKFLVKYHNLMVKAFNYLLSNIYYE